MSISFIIIRNKSLIHSSKPKQHITVSPSFCTSIISCLLSIYGSWLLLFPFWLSFRLSKLMVESALWFLFLSDKFAPLSDGSVLLCAVFYSWFAICLYWHLWGQLYRTLSAIPTDRNIIRFSTTVIMTSHVWNMLQNFTAKGCTAKFARLSVSIVITSQVASLIIAQLAVRWSKP